MSTIARKLTSQEIDSVWNKAKIIPNNDPNIFRQDYAGAWIRKDLFGRTDSEYGWQINYLQPITMGGLDDVNNMVPLQWQNDLAKGNDYPNWQTAITAEGVNNTQQVRSWFVSI